MFRTNSSGSKTIDGKLAGKTYTMHLERLNKIKRSSSQTLQLQNNNSELLKNASYLRNNDKKKELQKELEHIKIDKDNKILLSKMTQIVSNTQLRNTFYNVQNMQQSAEGRSRSMNHHVRKLEIEKIVVENPAIVQRIRQQTSFYNVKKWEKDFKARESYIKNLCEFPQGEMAQISIDKSPLGKSSMSPKKLLSTKQTKPANLHRRSFSSDLSTKQVLNDLKLSKGPRKLVLYKKEAEVDKNVYLVEFAVSGKKLYINMSCGEDSEVKSIALDDDRGKKLLIENNNSYERIISKLYLKDEKVYIKGFYEEELVRTDAKIELFNSLTNRHSPDQTVQTVTRSQEII